MKKITLFFSCLAILIGVITIITTSMLNEIMPKVGYAAYQNAANGIYFAGKYKMNFIFSNGMAIVLIIAGIIAAVLSFKKSVD